MKKWEKYSKEELQQFANEVYSYAALSEKIGYSKTGGSGTQAVKDMIKILQLDVSHFKGQGWNKNNFDYSRFKYGNSIKVANALPALVDLRGHKCEQCGNITWNNQKIPLEIHHLDGNHLNNDLNNLQLLCPNCHAQTDNYKGRNQKKRKEYSDEEYAKALKENPNVRQALLSLGLDGSGGNYSRAYDIAHKYNIQHILDKIKK